MTPDQYQKVNALADGALALPAGERAAFLDEACGGDPAVRRRVEHLIGALTADDDFLAAPLLEVLAQDMAATRPGNDLAGQQIRQYQVVSRIGAGGIGEVWLARDTQLTREAALKLLSPQFAGDPYHVRRFRLEARAASLLNHPNIITIYDIGEHAGTDFIAEEFVAGETLRQRLRRGPLDVAQALDIGIQVAAALAAAHAAGIVHRDIKPENIMIRPDGLVKVLDFGLAQFVEHGPGDESLSRPGIVLGTVRYMSPEQARGLPVNAPSDIFSLGSVLYEMLAGEPPFSGATSTDVLAAILNQEPAPLSRSPLPIPPEFERIVARCLEKDAGRRYESGAALRRDLRSLAGALSLTELSSSEVAVAATGSRPRTRVWSLAALLAGLGVVTALLIFELRRPPDAAFERMMVSRVATRGESTGAAISPDGKYVAYVTREDGESIWTTQPATGSDVRVVEHEPGEHVGIKFSPDGNYLYYRLNTPAGAYDLYRVPALGGTPLKVLSDVPGSIAFSPDGKRIALVRIDPARMESSLMLADADGSGTRIIRTRRRPEYYSRNGIAWSSDGSAVACFAGQAIGYSPQAFQLVKVRVADGVERPISRETWAWVDSVAWSADGRVVAVDASKDRQDLLQLWLMAASTGRSMRLTNDLSNYRRLTMSGDGKQLVALETRREADLWVAPVGAPESAARVASQNVRGLNGLAWTPDDKVVFAASNRGRRDIWTIDADGTNQRQISAGPADKQEVAVTRDGRYILYSARGSIWRMDRNGGNPVPLTAGHWDVHPTSSADSRLVVYVSFRNWSPAIWGKPTLWRIPIDGGRSEQITNEAASLPTVSPDGTKIACIYYPGPNPEHSASPMAVLPFRGGGPLRVFDDTSLAGSAAYWTSDGKGLIYSRRVRGVGNLWRRPLAGGPAVAATDFRTEDLFDYAFSTDFSRMALARGKESSDVVLITGLR